MLNREPWIGLVHVRPSVGSHPFGNNQRGAYGNVLALAYDAEHYREVVVRKMADNEMHVVDFQDVAKVSDYAAEGRIFGEIEVLHEALSEAFPVQYHTFHSYSNDNA